jgi:hypothetical protein
LIECVHFADPDITKGDGIYSSYFTGFLNISGYYSIQIKVLNNHLNAMEAQPVDKIGK